MLFPESVFTTEMESLRSGSRGWPSRFDRAPCRPAVRCPQSHGPGFVQRTHPQRSRSTAHRGQRVSFRAGTCNRKSDPLDGSAAGPPRSGPPCRAGSGRRIAGSVAGERGQCPPPQVTGVLNRPGLGPEGRSPHRLAWKRPTSRSRAGKRCGCAHGPVPRSSPSPPPRPTAQSPAPA